VPNSALVSVNAAGTLTITTSGDATISGGGEPGAYVSLVSGGSSTYQIGGTLTLTGGSGSGAYALIDPSAPTSNVSVTAQNINVTGGSGNGAYAAIEGANVTLNSTAGSIALTGGSGQDADAVVVVPNGGTITVNSPSCSGCEPVSGTTPIGDGTTEAGFYTVVVASPPAAPPASPPASPPPAGTPPPPAPAPGNPATGDQGSIDIFVSDLVTLLDLPLSAQTTQPYSSAVYIDARTDGCM
jgi:hypothetical protein